jgi:hypothetical protein
MVFANYDDLLASLSEHHLLQRLAAYIGAKFAIHSSIFCLLALLDRLGVFRSSERRQRNDQRIGSAVVDLIFSIAKREVTFVSGTAEMSRL